MAKQEVIRGQIANIRILKEGWGKLELQAGSGDDCTTVTGQVLGLELGSTVECRGFTDYHPKYGRQFKANLIEVVVPSDASGAIAWLCRLPGLGRKRAAELVERHGLPNLWHVLEHSPELLTETRGITPELAREIAAEYSKIKGDRAEAVQLRGWGLTDAQIRRCREVWKDQTIAELQRDPFQLCELVWGFGFTRADVVAQKMGLPHDHPSRIQACLLHQLGEAEGAGHCYVPTGKLVGLAAGELGVDEKLVWRQLDAINDGVRAVQVAETCRIYRAQTEGAEATIAKRVRALLATDDEERAA